GGHLRHFVAQLLVRGEFSHELPQPRIGERLDRVRALRFARNRARALRAERLHLVDERLRGKELALLPREDRGLLEAERGRELLPGAGQIFAKRFEIARGHRTYRNLARASMSAKPRRFWPRHFDGSRASGFEPPRPIPHTQSRGLASTSTF